MPKTVETYRTTKALRDLVRKAARLKASARRSSSGRQPRRRPGRSSRPGHGRSCGPCSTGCPLAGPPTTPRPSASVRPWPGWRGAGRVRTVLDSSVLVAALVTPNPASASRIILAAASEGAVRLIVSDPLEEEYRRAVECRQVIRYAAKVNRKTLVSAVVAVADRVLPGEATGLVTRDPADDRVLAAAIGGRADWVVSLDRRLIDLAEVEGVRILRPGDFLVELRRRDG